MATDFAPYINLRVLWTAPGTITSFRDGVTAAGTAYVVDAFAKRAGTTDELTPGIKAGLTKLSGYICRYAPLPTGTVWTAAPSAFQWVTTGERPPAMLPGATGSAILGMVMSLPTVMNGNETGILQFTELGGTFGIGGIGEELRAELGDKFAAVFGTSLS
jgi:hypothetical protein